MGAKESKAQVIEYVLKEGKQGVFSHADKDVCAAKRAALIVEALNQGVDRKLTMHKRVVTYAGSTVPVGEESIGMGEVTETEVS